MSHEKTCPVKKTGAQPSQFLLGWLYCATCKRLVAPEGVSR